MPRMALLGAGAPMVAAPINPSTVSGLIVWLKADTGTYQDDARTTAAGNGEPVAGWADQSGEGNHTTKYDDATRPTLVTGVVNSLPVVRFNGSHLLSLPAASIPTSTATIFAVYAADNNTGVRLLIGFNTGGGTNARLYMGNSATGIYGRMGGATDSGDVESGTLSYGAFFLHSLVAGQPGGIPDKLCSYTNPGVIRGTGNFANSALFDYTTIGANRNGGIANHFDGDLAELLIYNRPLGIKERRQVERYLASRYGLTLEDTSTYYGGAWTWFGAPRAVYYNNRTYTGYVSKCGDILFGYYNHPGGTFADWETLSFLQRDDHNNPHMLIRDSDKRILAFYTAHGDPRLRLRISTNPEDITSFGNEVNLDTSLGGSEYDYPTPVQLLDEANDPIYLFWRGTNGSGGYSLYMSSSTNDGSTWAAQAEVFQAGAETVYFRATQNGTARIDFVVTNGHPNDTATSLYHFYYQGGNYYQTDGTLIGNSAVLPLDTTDITLVYDGTTTRGWLWDMAIDGSGYPVIVYATFPTPASDHRYRYARWNGLSWDDNEIVAAGGPLYAGEPYYSGGICLDSGDPDNVYLSKVVSGQWEIYKYTTADGGGSWGNAALTTSSSKKNIRPFVPVNYASDVKVLWLYGDYTSFTDYDMALIASSS